MENSPPHQGFFSRYTCPGGRCQGERKEREDLIVFLADLAVQMYGSKLKNKEPRHCHEYYRKNKGDGAAHPIRSLILLKRLQLCHLLG